MDKYVGKRLDGRYEIREIIGVGGMAYVYKAYDRIDDRIVAVKILKDEYLANEEFTRRFKNESKAIAILSNPNIVKVYDVSFGERMQYIVMEYIDGITLKEYMDQQQDIKWKEAVHFTVQILRALQHAHDKGIVHRDIKPQNIMLLPDGTIKVTDFGIARFSRNEIRATGASDKAIGSVHYISPEQARGDITDEKADIYSTGVMLYEMLTGRLPFEADNAVSVAIMQLQSEAKLPRDINPQIPEGLEEITIKAMQKDPAKRYQSAAEMLYDIEEFKRNPSIHFEYTYFEDKTPTKFVETITRVKGEDTAGEEAEDLEDDEEDDGEKKGPPVLPILAAIAGAFVLVGLIFVGIIFLIQTGGNQNESLMVETFVGKTLTDVVNNPEYKEKYKFLDPVQKYDDAPEGEIIAQEPEAGSSKKPGQSGKVDVTLTISRGKKLVQIPEVKAGEHEDEVIAKLKAEGFTIVNPTEMSSDEVEKGFVIKTSPSYPDQVDVSTPIQVFVSTGKEKPAPVKVPDVTKMPLANAQKMLSEAGFLVKTQAVNTDVTQTKDVVLEQSLAKESMQEPGAEILLTVSSGFRDVKDVQIPLSNINMPIDIDFFVDGQQRPELSKTRILPRDIGTLVMTFKEQKASYRLTVMIKPEGAAKFTEYVSYTLNGVKGTAQMIGEPVLPTAATTTAATTATSTSGSTSTGSGESTTTSSQTDPEPTGE